MAETKPKTTTPDSEDKKKSAAYTAATTTLREAHREEFVDYLKKEYADRGLTYTPRKTARERAAEDLARIAREFPDLVAVEVNTGP